MHCQVIIRASFILTVIWCQLRMPVAAIAAPPGVFAVGVLQKAFVRESATWGSRRLAATIWYPATGMPDDKSVAEAPPAKGRFPVVVYSHGGCGGSAKAIEPVALSIASNGFVFVQFPHPGSTTDDCVSGGERYTRALLERPDDIVFVIDELARLDDDLSWTLHGVAETTQVGIVGHSQGGQTALMMPARDRRVHASLSLSPSVAHPDSPSTLWEAIRAARVPVIIVHGERDATWTSRGPLKAYESLPSGTPKAYLEVGGMGHTPSTPDEVALVIRYATALFQLYLKQDKSAGAILSPSAAPQNVSFKGSLID